MQPKYSSCIYWNESKLVVSARFIERIKFATRCIPMSFRLMNDWTMTHSKNWPHLKSNERNKKSWNTEHTANEQKRNFVWEPNACIHGLLVNHFQWISSKSQKKFLANSFHHTDIYTHTHSHKEVHCQCSKHANNSHTTFKCDDHEPDSFASITANEWNRKCVHI